MEVFQPDKELVETYYQKNENYCIINTKSKNKKCLILFSSNGLYFPNTEESFIEKIVNNDRYDFRNITKSRKIEKQFEKFIYVRDLWRAWYVRGINGREDSIDKLLVKLEELTEGYEVVTAGNSAGGYMAVIAGIHLKAKRVLSFSGQFYLEKRRGIVALYEEDKERNKYFDVTGLLEKSETPIIYFYPGNCEADRRQAQKVKNIKNVYAFSFDYAEHAQTVVPYNYKYLFDMSTKRYKKICRRLEGKKYKAIKFLLITGGAEGFIDCVREYLKQKKKRNL